MLRNNMNRSRFIQLAAAVASSLGRRLLDPDDRVLRESASASAGLLLRVRRHHSALVQPAGPVLSAPATRLEGRSPVGSRRDGPVRTAAKEPARPILPLLPAAGN